MGLVVHKSVEDAVRGANCVIIGTAHAEFKKIDLSAGLKSQWTGRPSWTAEGCSTQWMRRRQVSPSVASGGVASPLMRAV